MIVDRDMIPGFTLLGRLATGGRRFRSSGPSVTRTASSSPSRSLAYRILTRSSHPRERFRREAAVLERVTHPSLPRFFGYGVTTGVWLDRPRTRRGTASRRVLPPAGGDLLPLLHPDGRGAAGDRDRGNRSPRRFARQHPGRGEGGRYQARLIDFGIAKDLLAGEGASGLTQHGAFLGKLQYASLEQIMGLPRGQTIDLDRHLLVRPDDVRGPHRGAGRAGRRPDRDRQCAYQGRFRSRSRPSSADPRPASSNSSRG